MTPPALEIADLIRTAGAAFVERIRRHKLTSAVCTKLGGGFRVRRSRHTCGLLWAQLGAATKQDCV